ncbi:hypothetical protein AAG906_014894 [Vitis piasezkii]
MEEFALVHDSRFYSMEEHMDQYQTGVTSHFDHFQQGFERIEERMDQQQATFEHLQQSIDRIESRQRVGIESLACVSSSTPSALRLSRDPFPFLFYVFGAKRFNRSTGCARPIEDLSRKAKKFLSLLVAFSSWSRGFSSRSSTGRGPVEATVTCHALNAPTASEPVDP